MSENSGAEDSHAASMSKVASDMSFEKVENASDGSEHGGVEILDEVNYEEEAAEDQDVATSGPDDNPESAAESEPAEEQDEGEEEEEEEAEEEEAGEEEEKEEEAQSQGEEAAEPEEETAQAGNATSVPVSQAAEAAPSHIEPKSTAESEQGEPSSSTAGAPPQAAAPSKGSAGAEMDLKQLEAQATKVAQEVQHAAVEMSNKLTAGFKSALGGLGTTESPSLSKLAGGLASWWSSLDPPSQPQRNEQAERVQASSKATSELQDLFGLLPEENLVETFTCKLLQTYGCNHNSFTPAIQMAFQGTMYITDKHMCFSVEERNRKLPFKVAHTDITKAIRQRPQRKGDLSDVLRLDLPPSSLGQPQFLAFKDFESGSALDSALALVEHLMDGS